MTKENREKIVRFITGVVFSLVVVALLVSMVIFPGDWKPKNILKGKYSVNVRVDADGFLAGTGFAQMYCSSYKKTDNRVICYGASGQILDDVSFPDRALVDISMID